MTTDDLHRIHELEALLAQALSILVQVDDGVKALKPVRKTRKLSNAEMIKDYKAILNRRGGKNGGKRTQDNNGNHNGFGSVGLD